MRTQLIVRLRPGFSLFRREQENENELEWGWLDKDGLLENGVYTGSLSRLSQWRELLTEEEQEVPVILLVSGDHASSYRKSLQKNQRRHWQQALPYLLEEQLATDIEDLHLVAVPGDSVAFANASWIPCASMEMLISCFRDVGVELQRMLPESQCFFARSDMVSIWLEGEAAYVASPDSYGQLMDRSALEVIVPGLLEEDEPEELSIEIDDTEERDGPENNEEHVHAAGVRIFCPAGAAAMVEHLTALAGVKVEQCERQSDSLLPVILPVIHELNRSRELIDFRTGAYKCTRKASKQWQQWRPAVIVAGIWLGLELLVNIGSGFYFEHQEKVLKEQNLATYKELRPDDRRVVDVRHSLTRFLESARTQDNQAVFLHVLKTLSSVSTSSAGKDVTPGNMDFNDSNGRLVLDVRAESFETLNRYVSALKSAGLKVEMENGNQDSKGVSARLIVRGA